MKYLWILVSKDEYELPLIVADSPQELAQKVGTTANCISSAISHARKRNQNSQFKKVIIDEDWTD